MIATSKHNRRNFFLIALAIYFGNHLIAKQYRIATDLAVPEWPIAIDFFLLVPFVYLILFRPPLKRALLAILGLVSVGILIGSYIVPSADKHAWIVMEKLRWVFLGVVALMQVTLLWLIGLDLKRNWHAPNLERSIHAAIAKRIGDPGAAKLIQTDARMWLYAFIRNRNKFQFEEPRFFSKTHDSNASNQQAFLIIIAAEIPIAHVLIHLFNPALALLVSAFSLYGLIFLYSEYRATLLRPTTLGSDAAHLRSGILVDIALPYDAISHIQQVGFRPRRRKFEARYIGTGTANVKISLKAGTALQTLMGTQLIETVYLGLDEPQQFIAQINQKIATP